MAKELTKEWREVVVASRLVCDRCGRKSSSGSDWGQNHGLSDPMLNSDFARVETVIQYSQGVYYPESGTGMRIDVVLCPACFMTVLIPFLRSQGVQIDEVDASY